MNIHPLNKIKIAGTVIAIAVVALVAGIDRPDTSYAQNTGSNTHGYLWSDMPHGSDHAHPSGSGNAFGGRGLGWISVNSTDAGAGGAPYGVSLNMTTGDLSGFAWSEYGGWLNFDPAGPYPTNGGGAATSAKIMPSCFSDAAENTCPVIGWIKFSGGGSAQSGGWDGWVNLNTNNTNPAYGVSYNKTTKQFGGLAWGDWVAGWIDFSRMTVDVVVDPIVPPLPEWMRCRDAAGQYYFYLNTSPRPAACDPTIPSVPVDPNDPEILDPLDFCQPLPPGNQRRNDLPMQHPANSGVWYGLAGLQCIKSVCPNYNKFYATPPDGEIILPNGTCGKVIDYCQANPQNCQPVNGVIRPIYRED